MIFSNRAKECIWEIAQRWVEDCIRNATELGDERLASLVQWNTRLIGAQGLEVGEL